MTISSLINIFSLLPNDENSRNLMINRLHDKACYILLIGGLFAGFSFILNFIAGFATNSFTDDVHSYFILLVDGIRAIYYFSMLIIGRYYRPLQTIGAWSLPLVFAISLTEACIFSNAEERVYIR